MQSFWEPNTALLRQSRILDRARRFDVSALNEVVVLIMLGTAAAALTSIAASPIRLPGHAILRGALPLILGLSVAPRCTAGSLMSIAAAACFAIAAPLGLPLPPLPAIVGVLILGPALDLATTVAKGGRQLYLRFALAGLAANLAAFAVRMVIDSPAAAFGPGMGRGTGMGRPLNHAVGITQTNPAVALISFAIFGVAAGLVCGVAWFRSKPRSEVKS